MKQVINLILEAIISLLLLMSGVSIDLSHDVFVMHEYETYDCTVYDECMNNSYNHGIVPTVSGSANHTVMNMYEPEPVYTIKEYVVELNTSINRSERIGYWTCYDYSVDFAKNNHDWGIVTTSYFEDFENPNIYGVDSHMINYYLYDNETMIVYDALQDNMYISYGWKYDCRNYYHFWQDGTTPLRRYYEMSDNRDVVM